MQYRAPAEQIFRLTHSFHCAMAVVWSMHAGTRNVDGRAECEMAVYKELPVTGESMQQLVLEGHNTTFSAVAGGFKPESHGHAWRPEGVQLC